MDQCYVYKWTNIKTNKWYIGGRYSNTVPPEIDPYCTSSKIVKKLIKANPDEWIREILFVGNKTDAYNKETEFLQKLDARNNPDSYNQHNNEGFGEIQVPAWNKGMPCSPTAKAKLSKANKGRIPWNKGIPSSEETRKKISEAAKGRKPTEEQRKKNSDALKGRIPWNKGKSLPEHHVDNLKGRIPWNKGKSRPLGDKMCPICSKIVYGSHYSRHYESCSRSNNKVNNK